MDADELAVEGRKHRVEIFKLIVSALTPVVLAFLTYVINGAIQERGAALKREEQILAEKQRIYAELGRRLNIFYVYAADVGDFRAYEPPRVIEYKREADRQFFMYRPYWSPSTRAHYNAFMLAVFKTYNGAGLPAKIRARRGQKAAAYEIDRIPWNAQWDMYFTEETDDKITEKYYELVNALLKDTVSPNIHQ